MTKRELVHNHRDAILGAAAALGADRIRLFGSVARGDEREDSDIDFIVRMKPEMDVFDLVELQDRLRSILGCEVDVLTEHRWMRDRLKNEIEEAAVEP
jgi:predicted nucleotidyltransferase